MKRIEQTQCIFMKCSMNRYVTRTLLSAFSFVSSNIACYGPSLNDSDDAATKRLL